VLTDSADSSEVAAFFEPSIHGIIDAIKEQMEAATKEIEVCLTL
jgi:hypothetical protein